MFFTVITHMLFSHSSDTLLNVILEHMIFPQSCAGLSEAQKIKRDNSVLLNNTLLGYDPLIDDPQVENAVVVKAFEVMKARKMASIVQ